MSAVRHLRLRKKLGPYLDGELDGRARAAVAAHVQDCWFCSGDLQTLKLIRGALRRRSSSAASLPVVRLRRFGQRLERP